MLLSRLKLIFTITTVFGCMLTGILLLSWKNPADVAESVTESLNPQNSAEPAGPIQAAVLDTASVAVVANTPVVTVQDPVAKKVITAVEPISDTVIDPVSAPVVVMIAGPGVSKRCEVMITDPETANKVMKQASTQCHFSYSGKDYASLGWFVDTIAGVSANKKTGQDWIYYVNDTLANVGVSTYHIQPGDTITWKYEQDY